MKHWKNLFRKQPVPKAPSANLRESVGFLQEIERALREVLATYEGNETFHDALRRVLEQRDPGSSEQRLLVIKQFIKNHSRAEDAGQNEFTIARHLLEDLHGIYGLKPTLLPVKDEIY
ncbi:MAG: hypothetical protein V4671_23625 [Armatimonadota bacterium]